MFVIRKKLDAREGAPPRTRVNPETGVVETTPDDGATWVEDPRSDPRQNPAYMRPPPSAPDVKCAAAAGMVENVRRVIDGAAGGTTVAGIATILLTLLLIPGIGWMFAAMLLFASSFVTATSAAVLAAFTEDVYDFLLCSFYDNIDADGKVSWEQLQAVQAAAAAEFENVLVGDILAGIMQMHREVGFTNAGVVYADPDADCECAEPWCRMLDFRIDPYGFVVVSLGNWVEGVGFETDWLYDGTNSYRYVDIVNHDLVANITHIEFAFEYTKGSVTAGGGNTAIGVFDDTYTQTFWNYLLDAIPPVPGSPLYWVDPEGGEQILSLVAQLITGILGDANADPGGTGTLIYLKLCGKDEPPPIGVECDPDECGEE